MRFLRDNGLSLAFWLLFAATLAGDVLCAVALGREEYATIQPPCPSRATAVLSARLCGREGAGRRGE